MEIFGKSGGGTGWYMKENARAMMAQHGTFVEQGGTTVELGET